MTISNAQEALALFDRSSVTLDQVLGFIEDAARRNRRFVKFDGWPSDAVVEELKRRGFTVDLCEVLIPSTKVYW